jgi:lactonase
MNSQLNYLPGDRYCPECEIQIAEAEYFCQIGKERNQHLEGICFDRNGDIYLCGIFDGSIRKINMKNKEASIIYQNPDWAPVAIKIHKDGRLFVCSVRKKMGIYTLNPDGSNFTSVLPGIKIDDMVFTSEGGFYFTKYLGDVANPIGGVYYVDPEMKSISPVIEHLAGPNGVALSTNEKILWITETGRGNLYRIDLEQPSHSSVPYHFTGYLGPDSCSVDEDDNLYVAMVFQGQVMVFNPFGWPIAKITLPNRKDGANTHTTHPMVHPYEKELYIVAADDVQDNGSSVFRAPSFAKGNRKAYQFT